VGIHDNFFGLGGHSLLLARVKAEIGKRMGLEISIIDLFQYPTIEALAHHLRGGDRDPPAAPGPPAIGRRTARRERRQARLARRAVGSSEGARE
jgi:hypothetical protein